MMKMLFAGFLLVALMGAAVVAQTKDEAIFKQTKAVNDASLQGHVERNVDKIVRAYADDAIILPPGAAEPIRGVRAIREYYENGLKSGRSLKITTENISFEAIDSRHAVEVGRYTILYKADNAEKEIEIKGLMLITWEKNKKGEWKIKTDMWH